MTTLFSSRADDDVPPGIRAAAERIEAHGRRTLDQPPSVPSLREIGAIVAIVSMAFTVGYNWKEITSLRTDYDKHVMQAAEDHKLFMLREVSDIQYREIQRQLFEINKLLEQALERKR